MRSLYDFEPTGPAFHISTTRTGVGVTRWRDEGGSNVVFQKDSNQKLKHPSINVCVTTGKLPAGLREKAKSLMPEKEQIVALGGAEIRVRNAVVRETDLGVLVVVPEGRWPSKIEIAGETIDVWPGHGAFITDAVPQH